jgi:hypothetical protein
VDVGALKRMLRRHESTGEIVAFVDDFTRLFEGEKRKRVLAEDEEIREGFELGSDLKLMEDQLLDYEGTGEIVKFLDDFTSHFDDGQQERALAADKKIREGFEFASRVKGIKAKLQDYESAGNRSGFVDYFTREDFRDDERERIKAADNEIRAAVGGT